MIKTRFLMLGATYLANAEKLLLSKTQNNLMFLLRYKRAKTAGINAHCLNGELKTLVFCNTMVQQEHGLRTPNEGINQRYLKNWANVADKICFGRT